MESKTTLTPKPGYEKFIELFTWTIIVLVIFGVRFLPQRLIDTDQAYVLIGAIISFALFYYLVIYKYFNWPSRIYLKTIADIVLIGVLIHILKDYGQYFFALYFLPIAAAALSLEFISALLIATVASVFVALEIFLGSQNLLPGTQQLYQGAGQIALILLITIFCRALAMQLRQEKFAKEESLAREKVLKEEAQRQKEFLSLTSHQLFTPLSMIRGFVSMLDDDTLGKLDPKQKEAVGEIHDNTKRMVDLVSELLSISRIQSGTFEIKPKETDLEKIISHIINQFNQTRLKKDIKIVFEKPEKIEQIVVDEEKIRSVLYNLIDNAIKYTSEGIIKVALKQNKDWTTVRIIDEGVGIKTEDFEKLFQPFFRGKNILELDNQGTGLGLYIARLIIEKHGGKIWAENNPKKGVTFSFTIPNNNFQ